MYSFRPEPEPAEHAALERALEQLHQHEDSRPAPYRSEWRRAALTEGVSADEEQEDGAF
jgi:hypothetical protein